MPIRVQSADNAIHEFPDGTDSAVIDKAMKAYVQQQQPKGGAGEAALGGAVGGVPIIGPALKAGAQYAAGGIRSLITGQPFSEELEKVKGYSERTEKAHPTATTAGEVGGSLYGMGVAGAAAPAAMGLTGTLPQMIGRGAASGAAIGAADAVARGESPTIGGAVGGAGGAAGPVFGKAVGAIAKPVTAAVRGLRQPEEEAARRVGSVIGGELQKGQGALSPEQFSKAQKSGQPVMTMDIGGEGTRALARSAANTSPAAREVLNQAINQRYEQQGQRFNEWLGAQFNYPNAEAQQAALEQVAKTTNRENYQRAFERGSEGIWTPKLEQLAGSDAVSGAMQAAVKQAKDESIIYGYGAMRPNITFTPDGRIQFTRGAKGVPTYPDLQYWDLVRRNLSDSAKAAFRAGHDTLGRRYTHFAAELNAELDRMVPAYKAARAGAAGFFNAENALEAGQKAVTSKMKNAQIKAGLMKMTDNERKLFQDGYVDRIMASVREAPDRRSVVNKFIGSEAARERLDLAVGPARSKEIQAFLHIENVMDFARKAVQGNSTTARQLAELGMAGGVGAGTELYDLYQGKSYDPHSVVNAVLTYGAIKGKTIIDQRVAEAVAKMLTSQDMGQLQRALTLIANNKSMFNAVKNADAAIGSIATRGTVTAAQRGMMRSPQPAAPQQQDKPQYGGPMQ